jgi:hypothetical protein
LVLPPEYAEWSAGGGRVPGAPDNPAPPTRKVATDGGGVEAAVDSAFHILSPRDGDRYRIPPGVPARFATVPFLASVDAGVAPAGAVRWFVDGRPLDPGQSRWRLVPGRHVVRAEAAVRAAAGDPAHDEIRIVVDP